MKLPHQEPLVFAKEILFLDDKSSQVLCEFDNIPSLAICIEAAAQSCASFFQEGDFKMGYLANASNIELLDELEACRYLIHLEHLLSFDKLNKYSFIISNIENTKQLVSGELTVAVD